MELLKSIIYIALTAIMLGCEIIMPNICDSVAVFYVSLLTAYIGLDIWNMIKTTSVLPKGDFKEIKKSRYIVCILCYAVLIITGYVVQETKKVDLSGTFSTFISAVFILGMMLLGGLEGNKIATNYGADNSENTKGKEK